jgi:hypothetical protein
MGVPAEALRRLEVSYLEADNAFMAWKCWADDIRQEAEQRLGVMPGVQDPRIWGDPAYGAALDGGAPYTNARHVLARALERADPECAQASREGRLRLLVESRVARRAGDRMRARYRTA